jgi:hypothetical protein
MKVLRMTTDQLATDDRIADLLMEYAAVLGRENTTDTVELPVARGGHVEQASILLGPASQITITELHDEAEEQVRLPGVVEVVADLRRRIDRYSGEHTVVPEDVPDTSSEAFPDFGSF